MPNIKNMQAFKAGMIVIVIGGGLIYYGTGLIILTLGGVAIVAGLGCFMNAFYPKEGI